MKKILYPTISLALLSFILFLGGCKKSSSVNGLVASYTETETNGTTNTTTTYTYTYDGQGRLTELQITGQTPITVAYGSGTVTTTQGASVTIYTLNSAGLVSQDNQGNVYVFNSSGYLTNITNTAAGTSTVNTISNGNVVNSQSTSGTNTTTYSYTYLTTPEYRSYGQAFFGKRNSNLPNSLTVSTPTTTTYVNSYTFDGQGRVQTQTSIAGSITVVDTYTYTSN